MASVLTPTASWAQRKEVVFLTVKVPEIASPEIKVEAACLSLTCQGGSGKSYHLAVNFLKHIDPQLSRYEVQTSCVEFSLVKEEPGWWSRLCREEEKQHWLRMDYNNWQDEDEEESEDEDETDYETDDEESEGDVSSEVELEEGLAGLGLAENCSWAEGLSQEEQFEWITDCYRMRLDDECTLGGDIRPGTIYDDERDPEDMVQDFLVFCRLARARAALPTPWAWGTFLLTAAELLPETFEKSDAQEKYGGENIFQAAVGGRSLRHMGEVIYGSSAMTGQESELHRRYERKLLGKPRTSSMVAAVGGEEAWHVFEMELMAVLGMEEGESYSEYSEETDYSDLEETEEAFLSHLVHQQSGLGEQGGKEEQEEVKEEQEAKKEQEEGKEEVKVVLEGGKEK